MSQLEVIVYTSTGCPYCEKVKEKLTEWGIEFEVRNVSLHKEYFDELRAKKVFGTPATYINGNLILGFQEKKFKQAFALDEQENQETKRHTKAMEDQAFSAIDSQLLTDLYDIVIIGGGPAGASAAVYCARAKLKTLIIDKAPKDSSLALTHKIANYPGVRETITGLELLTRMHFQAKDFGAKLIRSSVLAVNFTKEIKEVTISEGIVKAKAVFIAVGVKAPNNNIIGEEQFVGRGVSYCTTCDAAFYDGKIVVVVGESDEAFMEALTLAQYCKEVRLIIPDKINGEVNNFSILEQKDNVTIFNNYHVKEMKGKDNLEYVVVLDNKGQEVHWDVDGVFLYLNDRKPGTEFLNNKINLDYEGYVIVDDHLRTNVAGVFAGGDARSTPMKQALLAAADGAIAALSVQQYLNRTSKIKPHY